METCIYEVHAIFFFLCVLSKCVEGGYLAKTVDTEGIFHFTAIHKAIVHVRNDWDAFSTQRIVNLGRRAANPPCGARGLLVTKARKADLSSGPNSRSTDQRLDIVLDKGVKPARSTWALRSSTSKPGGCRLNG